MMAREPTEMELRSARAAYTRMTERFREKYPAPNANDEMMLRNLEEWFALEPAVQNDWIEYVRAAIRVMLRPTDEMLAASMKAAEAISGKDLSFAKSIPSGVRISDLYAAMINAASPEEK